MPALMYSHMALSCEDPLTIERFYTKHLGFKRARVIQLGEDQIVFIKMGDVYLELFRATKAATTLPVGGNGPEYPGWRHLAFKVDNIDAKLAEMGGAAKITLGPLDFGNFIQGWRTVWIADPEGNIVEISQGYTDQEKPPPLEV